MRRLGIRRVSKLTKTDEKNLPLESERRSMRQRISDEDEDIVSKYRTVSGFRQEVLIPRSAKKPVLVYFQPVLTP